MRTITLRWETWRAVFALLRAKGLSQMLEFANVMEEQLERRGPDDPIVRLSLTDVVILRSYTRARW